MSAPNSRRLQLAAVIGIVLSAAVLVSGCCGSRLVLTRDEQATTRKQLEQEASVADVGRAGSIDVADAPNERQAALAALRTQGADGTKAAGMLTKGFPEGFPAVPVIARLSKVDGADALVVVEAYGGETGKLDRRRLWIFDWETGAVIRSTLVD